MYKYASLGSNKYKIEVPVILDSGASVTLINKEIADELEVEYDDEMLQLTNANGESFYAFKTKPIYIQLEGTRARVEIPVYVTPNTNDVVLLGVDFLMEAGADLNFETNKIVIYSNKALSGIRKVPRPLQYIGAGAGIGALVGGALQGKNGVVKGAAIGGLIGLGISLLDHFISGCDETQPASY